MHQHTHVHLFIGSLSIMRFHASSLVPDRFSLHRISIVVLLLLSAASAWLQEIKAWFDAAADGPGWPESKLVPGACRVAKFNGVHTLILHIPENFGADRTRVTFIGIKGDFTEVGLPPALFVDPFMTSGMSSATIHLVCHLSVQTLAAKHAAVLSCEARHSQVWQ